MIGFARCSSPVPPVRVEKLFMYTNSVDTNVYGAQYVEWAATDWLLK